MLLFRKKRGNYVFTARRSRCPVSPLDFRWHPRSWGSLLLLGGSGSSNSLLSLHSHLPEGVLHYSSPCSLHCHHRFGEVALLIIVVKVLTLHQPSSKLPHWEDGGMGEGVPYSCHVVWKSWLLTWPSWHCLGRGVGMPPCSLERVGV